MVVQDIPDLAEAFRSQLDQNGDKLQEPLDSDGTPLRETSD